MAGLQKRTIADFIGYLIGEERFRSKEAVAQRVQSILYAYDLGQRVKEEDACFLLALLQNHERAEEKIGPGVGAFEVQPNPRFPTKYRGFIIVRVDGSELDFSYKKCLKPPSPKNVFLDTCRFAIGEQTFIFKHNYFSRHQNEQGQVQCPITKVWLTRTQAHVDHHPLTFEQIVDNFIALRGLDITRVELVSAPDGDDIGREFADKALEADWCAYHKEQASLRVVSRLANLGQIRRAHNRTPQQLSLFDDV